MRLMCSLSCQYSVTSSVLTASYARLRAASMRASTSPNLASVAAAVDSLRGAETIFAPGAAAGCDRFGGAELFRTPAFNRDLVTLSSMFAFAKREGHVAANPWRTEDFRELKLREPRPKPNAITLSPQQLDAFLDAAEKLCAPAYGALFRLTAGSGIRIDEARHLDLADVRVVDEQGGKAELTVTPKPGWTSKGYRYRTVPIPMATATAARTFVEGRGKFAFDDATTWKHLNKVREAVGLPRFKDGLSDAIPSALLEARGVMRRWRQAVDVMVDDVQKMITEMRDLSVGEKKLIVEELKHEAGVPELPEHASLYNVINAVTSAAHQAAPARRLDIETYAGELLFNHVGRA